MYQKMTNSAGAGPAAAATEGGQNVLDYDNMPCVCTMYKVLSSY